MTKDISEKCLKQTVYGSDNDGTGRVTIPRCIYYDPEKGCELNGCIKNFKKQNR